MSNSRSPVTANRFPGMILVIGVLQAAPRTRSRRCPIVQEMRHCGPTPVAGSIDGLVPFVCVISVCVCACVRDTLNKHTRTHTSPDSTQTGVVVGVVGVAFFFVVIAPHFLRLSAYKSYGINVDSLNG